LVFGYADLGKNELQAIADVYQFPMLRFYPAGKHKDGVVTYEDQYET
jgi:hypothetical protein